MERLKYTDASYIDIKNPMTMEVDIKAGRYYYFYAEINRTYRDISISMLDGSMNDQQPALQVGVYPFKSINDYMVYLEPYDSNVPLESQSFLELRNGIYVVGFNGSAVSWGGNYNYRVTIGIPAGRHELQFAYSGKLYTLTFDARPQQRYRVEYSLGGRDSQKYIVRVKDFNTRYAENGYEATEIGTFTRPK